ncbi:ABC transporter ATP-binding protein [Gulosibacter sp. ACHW.36C]|uniref:ABC transporter ATP-binding protein n=1 Tax=Gulosibacter sediminis TaxID=1729695 RepID=A0ABY4MYI7_9MICO|nr:ABC transporter ATP-binding protein [Gulosibacter sediminis]UQN15501.1 ABC transporter ATP-binding protein [Gulosibacter sediminis]
MTKPALELRGVTVRYPDGSTPVRDIDLTVADGEVVALLGASGLGKSSLLRGIAGLERVSAGEVWMRGELVTELPTHRRGCGMVFQDGQLFPYRSVAKNLAYGLEVAGMPKAQRRERVAEMLELVDLPGYEDRAVQTLSGGQAQRVALARSLAVTPRLLLLDEPLSALDADLRGRLAVDLRNILKSTGTAAIYVTHDRQEATTIADRVVDLEALGQQPDRRTRP